MTGTISNKFALSASRLDHVFKAESLGEAQRMGLWDKFKDLLRGGIKKEAIRHAFTMLKSVKDAGERADHEGLLEHFNTLRLGLHPQHTRTLKLNVSVNESTKTWAYRISIFGQQRAHASGLKIGDGFTLQSFRDCKLLARAGSWLYERHGVDAGDKLTRLHDRFLILNMEGINGQKSAAQVRLAKACDMMRALDELGNVPKSVQVFADFEDVSRVNLSMGAGKGRQLIIDSPLELKTLEDFKSALVAKADLAAMRAVREVADIPKPMRIEGVLKDMVDGSEAKADLVAVHKDTFFSKKNFSRFEPHPNDSRNGPCFKAVYSDGECSRSLVFSDRASTTGELRADVLRELLSDAQYESIEDLVGGTLDTSKDNLLRYSLMPALNEIFDAEEKLLHSVTEGAFGLIDQTTAKKHVEEARNMISRSIYVGSVPLNDFPGWTRQVQVEEPLNRDNIRLLVDYDFA